MDLKAIGMGLAFAFMWSSAFTSARIIVVDAPPITALAVRFLISGLIAVAIARALGQTWSLNRGQWRATIVFGICQNALYLGLNFVALQTIEASLASIIASTMPILVTLAAWVFLREKIGVIGIAGMTAGMVGVTIVLGSRLGVGADPLGITLCAIGAVALTFATLLVRGASSGGNVLMIVGLQMLAGCAVLTVIAVVFEDWDVNLTWSLALAFIYTTLVPGLAATWIWFRLVNRIGAVKAATFHFLNPFLGISIAAVLLGEKIGPLDILGVIIIMVGILAVQVSRQTT